MPNLSFRNRPLLSLCFKYNIAGKESIITKLGSFTNCFLRPNESEIKTAKLLFANCLPEEKANCCGYVVQRGEDYIEVPAHLVRKFL